MQVTDSQVVNRRLLRGPPFHRRDLHAYAGAGAQPKSGLQVRGVDPLSELGDPERVTVGRRDRGGLAPLLAIDIVVTLTRFFRPWPLISAVTFSTFVFPVSGSVAKGCPANAGWVALW